MEIKNLIQVKNIEYLKTIGTVKEILNCINEIIMPLIAEANNFEELLTIVITLQKHWDSFHSQDMPYFKDEKSKYIFALAELDGTARNKIIGLTEDLYFDAKKAQRWYRNIVKKVHPDSNGNSASAKKAFEQLEIIFARIIKSNSSI